MRLRPLGKTGYEVAAIGFGAWAIGGSMWGGRDDDNAVAALEAALDFGVNFVDTAAVYGDGHSERLVGRVLQQRGYVNGRGVRCVIATKVPPRNMKWPPPRGATARELFPAAYLRACCERSLRNLGVERLDVLQLHVWNESWAAEDEWYEEMVRLRAEGKIGVIAASLNDHQPATALPAVAAGRLDVVQVIYNLFDQSPEDQLFAACERHGVGVIARCPFDEGSLTGKFTPGTRFPPGDFRNQYFRGERLKETVRRVDALRFLERPGRSLPQAALLYVLHAPAVATVIPGMRRPAQVEENVLAAQAPPLAPAEIAQAHQHRWPRNFYGGG